MTPGDPFGYRQHPDHEADEGEDEAHEAQGDQRARDSEDGELEVAQDHECEQREHCAEHANQDGCQNPGPPALLGGFSDHSQWPDLGCPDDREEPEGERAPSAR